MRCLIFSLSIMLTCGSVHATPIDWSGSGGGDWDTAGNWTPSQVPTSVDDVTIPTGSAIIGSIVNADALSVTVQAAGGLDIHGGTLSSMLAVQSTSGLAMASPKAVVTSAKLMSSASPVASTCSLVLSLANAPIMPTTVPSSPTMGALLITV